jgi:hypothetical protein
MTDGCVGRHSFVTRSDNRDAGRSTRIAASPPGTPRQASARPRSDAYGLGDDLAQDTTGPLDHLGAAVAVVTGADSETGADPARAARRSNER